MDLIKKVYDSEHFRQEGHILIDLLADYLAQATSGAAPKVLPWMETDVALEHWQKDLTENAGQKASELFKKTLAESIQVHHPQYMGHQISPAAPTAALAGLVSDFLNNGMGVYEMGVVGSTLDRVVIEQVANQMGFGSETDGILTSGGTLANVTALLTARSIKAKAQVWKEGTQQQYALMVSDQAHYCVDRAVRIMGWGEAGIIKIPCNPDFSMRTELLEQYYQEASDKGIEVLAVVGSACSTSTGAYDDLDAIADFCQKYPVWFHVDGAHGAAVIYAPKYQHLVKGLSRADSVTMDFHKMLLAPSITTALVFKNGKLNFKTFAQNAQYLFEEQEGLDWFNMAKRTFECTKTMMSLKVYSLMRTYGTALFEEYVTKVIDITHSFANILKESQDFELATAPQCNIICFRHLGQTNLNAHNERIRQQLKEDGNYYIVKTSIDGNTFLRCTFTNPFTEEKHLLGLLDTLRSLASVEVLN